VKFVYAGGDTNVKDAAEDSASGQLTVRTVREAYQKFLQGKKLEEIYQPAPTRMDSYSWSRIDKFFVATPEGVDLETHMDLTVSLPRHPYPPGKGKAHPSDHFQILLIPSPATLEPGARRTIPVWMAKHPEFARRVKARWAKVRHKWRDPFKVLERFDATMVSVARIMMRDGAGDLADAASAFAVALTTVRRLLACEVTEEQARARCSVVPDLQEVMLRDSRSSVLSVLQKFVRQSTVQRE
jgi:hypothetical protein